MTDGRRPRLAVLADDLIWATRLESAARAAGAEPTVVATAERFAAILPEVDAALVDLSARRSDPIAAIAGARAAGRLVVAVGPHADVVGRKQALAAGATRVYAYSKLFDDGPRTLAAWLGLPTPSVASVP